MGESLRKTIRYLSCLVVEANFACIYIGFFFFLTIDHINNVEAHVQHYQR